MFTRCLAPEFLKATTRGGCAIEQMLAHRSGIANFVPDGSWGMQPRTKDEMVSRIAAGTPEFEPGARFGYSNSGYHLLGYIVEQAGCQPYQDALRE